jgi:hypothetical protein
MSLDEGGLQQSCKKPPIGPNFLAPRPKHFHAAAAVAACKTGDTIMDKPMQAGDGGGQAADYLWLVSRAGEGVRVRVRGPGSLNDLMDTYLSPGAALTLAGALIGFGEPESNEEAA